MTWACSYFKPCPGEPIATVWIPNLGRHQAFCGFHAHEVTMQYALSDPRKNKPAFHTQTPFADIEEENAWLVEPAFGTKSAKLLDWHMSRPVGYSVSDVRLARELDWLKDTLGSVRHALVYGTVGPDGSKTGGGWLQAKLAPDGSVVREPSGNGTGMGICWELTPTARACGLSWRRDLHQLEESA